MCSLNWQSVILIGWLVFLLVIAIVLCLYLVLRFLIKPKLEHIHEMALKQKAHEREIEWSNRRLTKEMIEKLELSPDQWLKNQMNTLTDALEKITKEMEEEKKKEEKVKESLVLRKEAYEEMLKHIRTLFPLTCCSHSPNAESVDKQE